MASDKAAMSIQEKKWRAESDARSLEEAEIVKADPARLKAAMGIITEKKAAMDKITAATGWSSKMVKGKGG